jgi:hypothetical protein
VPLKAESTTCSSSSGSSKAAAECSSRPTHSCPVQYSVSCSRCNTRSVRLTG